jgi:hypothetical protein
MYKYKPCIISAILLSIVLISCGKEKATQFTSEQKTNTPIIIPSSTKPATPLATTTPKVTPNLTASVRATLEAQYYLCIDSIKIADWEISPDGNWLAAECYAEGGKEESPLQVISIDRSKEWKIYYRDFAIGSIKGDRNDIIKPYRWSKDGKYLYAVAVSRLDGCCWIGGEYVLLIRLNLETGFQEDLINGTDFSTSLANSFTISENDRYLLFTPLTKQPYDFVIFDLTSMESRMIKLTESKPINMEFAVMSQNNNLVVLPVFQKDEQIELSNIYLFDSIILIDLDHKTQKDLITGLPAGEEFYPIRWTDGSHVILSNQDPTLPYDKSKLIFWILDINTGQRVKTDFQ